MKFYKEEFEKLGYKLKAFPDEILYEKKYKDDEWEYKEEMWFGDYGFRDCSYMTNGYDWESYHISMNVDMLELIMKQLREFERVFKEDGECQQKKN